MHSAPAFASKDAMDKAIGLVNAGRAKRGEKLCRDAVRDNPKDVNMVALLGAILLKTRRYEEAEKQLRLAIELAPSFAKPQEDLGRLLLEQKRAKEAIAVLRTATRLDPQLDDAFFSLGKALALLGKGKEADIAFEKSFDLNPERKALAHAAEHQREGRVDAGHVGCAGHGPQFHRCAVIAADGEGIGGGFVADEVGNVVGHRCGGKGTAFVVLNPEVGEGVGR